MYQCPLCPTRLQTEENWRKHMNLHVDVGDCTDISNFVPVKENLMPKEFIAHV